VDHVLGFVIQDHDVGLRTASGRLEEKLSPGPPFDLRRAFVKSSSSRNQARQRIAHGTSCAARRHGDVVDEFGSILGLVTKEDLLEQLVANPR